MDPFCPDDDDERDPARRAILARRARFVAVAIGAAGLAGCGERPGAQTCLKVYVAPPDGGPEAPASTETAGAAPTDAPTTPPAPCLEVVEPPPQVCLEVVEPPPQVCLDVVEPGQR